jgi:hypothetical protein
MQPIFKEIFGEKWDLLPIVMKKHYANRANSEDLVIARGFLDIKFNWFGKICTPLFKIFKTLIPYQGKNIPTIVKYQSSPNDNSVAFDRVLNFPNRKPFHFRSKMVPSFISKNAARAAPRLAGNQDVSSKNAARAAPRLAGNQDVSSKNAARAAPRLAGNQDVSSKNAARAAPRLAGNPNEIIEFMGMGIGWKMNYEFEDGLVKLKHKGYVLRIFGFNIPMPLSLLIGKGYAQEKTISEDEFSMFVTITHPLFGVVYQYSGQFKITSK